MSIEIGKTYNSQAEYDKANQAAIVRQTSSYNDAQQKRQSGTLGPVYLPSQFDNSWTHVAEEIGQNGTGEKALSTRALYPGDISNRFEIMVTVAKEIKLSLNEDGEIAKDENGVRIGYSGLKEDTPRWRKLHMGQASIGIKGRLADGTLVELKQRDGNDGKPVAQNTDGSFIRYWHPVSPPPAPGEVVELGVLTDDTGKRLSAPSTGGFFTARKNTDKNKVFLVRDLDTWIVNGEQWITQGGLPVDPKELTPEWQGMVLNAGDRYKYFEDIARKAKKDISSTAVKDEIQKKADEFLAKHDDVDYVKSIIKFGQDASANWFQKYKYACYFQPNTETRVDPYEGKIVGCKFGDLCVAYDWDSRQVWRRHNSGKATQETGRNLGSNPPLLYKKTHFYLQNQVIADWMLDNTAWKIDKDVDSPLKNVDELYTKSQKILDFIIQTRIGEGTMATDGAPRQAGALALTRMNGIMRDSAWQLSKLTTTSLCSAAGLGLVTAIGTSLVLTGGLAAAVTLPAIACGSLGAVYGFKVGSEAFAAYRSNIYNDTKKTHYDKEFNTKIYKSRNADAGSFAWKAYRDEFTFFSENLKGMIFSYFENDNKVANVDIAGKTGYYLSAGLAAGATLAFAGMMTASLALPLTAAAVICAGTSLGLRQVSHLARQGEERFLDIVFDEALQVVENDRAMSKDVNDHYMRASLETILKRPPIKHFKKARAEKKAIEAQEAKHSHVTLASDGLGATRSHAKHMEHSPTLAV